MKDIPIRFNDLHSVRWTFSVEKKM